MSKKPSQAPAVDPEEKAIQYLDGSLREQTAEKTKGANNLDLVGADEFEIVEEDGLENSEEVELLTAELDIELAGMAAEIIDSKSLGHSLLAKMSVEKNNLGHREGLYLILKIAGKPLIIFGDEHADKLNQQTIDMAYAAITSVEQFLEMGAEYAESMNIEQKNRLEKLRKELFTIGGIIRKYRFLGHNLLALMKIDRGLQEATFSEEKTDPKRLRMALIERGERIDCVEELRDGVYAVLSKGEAGMKVLGGKNAHLLDPEIAETIYESIQNPAHFFSADHKLKEYIKQLEEDVHQEIQIQAQRLQQIIDELEEPIAEEGETPEAPDIPEGKIDEELAKLERELDELGSEEMDDENTPA